MGGSEVEGWTATRHETRYGCFLPDLTGLARAPSTASLPLPNIGRPAAVRKGAGGGRCAIAGRAGRSQRLPDRPEPAEPDPPPQVYAATGLDRAAASPARRGLARTSARADPGHAGRAAWPS